MEILIATLVALVLAFAGKPLIKRFPVAMYAIAVLLDIVFLTQVIAEFSPVAERTLYPYFNRGLLGFGFLAVVMFVGVFDNTSSIRRWLNPIRGELSIIGALLCLPHVVNYLVVYIERLLAGFVGVMDNVIVSFFIAAVVTIILAALTVTSFNAVRRAMTAKRWKQVQRWAYPFFGLLYVHILLVLSVSASSGGKALTSLVVYTVLFVSYAILRGWKAWRDRSGEDKAQE